MPQYQIHFTTHLRDRSGIRNFTEAEAVECVNNPDWHSRGEDRDLRGDLVRTFRKKFADGTMLEIVAAVKGQDCYIKTGYWHDEESFR